MYTYVRTLLLIVFCTVTLSVHTQTSQGSLGLRFLYESSLGSYVKPLIVNSWTSKCAGWFANSSISKFVIPLFIKHYAINLEEIKNPTLASYKNLNDFFIREIKSETRPYVNDTETIVSPADGHIVCITPLEKSTEFLVKGKAFDTARFLANEKLAQEYMGGTLIVIYLAPHNYHRFHFPCTAAACKAQRIKGSYESVHPIAYRVGIQPLTENERHLITLQSPLLLEPILCIPVGALCVGQITETYEPGQLYAKAAEMGYFSFGGSTIALLFKPSQITVEPHLLDQQPHEIRMGQTIARCPVKAQQ